MEVRDRILSAAEELFLQYGIKSITMDEIARHLAVSKKTIYQFFKDKDEIVFLVTEQHLKKNQDKYSREIFDRAQNPLEELLLASQFIRTNVAGMNPAILFDMSKYHPNAWKLYTAYQQEFILAHIRRNLQQGIEQGYYHPDINVEIMAHFRIEQIQMAFDVILFPPSRFSITEVQVQLTEHFIRGIITEKGRQVLNEFTKKSNTRYAIP